MDYEKREEYKGLALIVGVPLAILLAVVLLVRCTG